MKEHADALNDVNHVLIKARARRRAVLGEAKTAEEKQTPSMMFYSVLAQSNSVIFGGQETDDNMPIGASISAQGKTPILVCTLSLLLFLSR